jgi:hypothetical protein
MDSPEPHWAVNLKGATRSEQFVETARALEVDESRRTFERALKVAAPLKPEKPSS